MLGHITTFGGHPLIAAAALATLKEINNGNYLQQVLDLEKVFRQELVHPWISEVRGKGLMLAAILHADIPADKVIDACREKGVLFFLLLFEKKAVRITPPYTVTVDEVRVACKTLKSVLDGF